MPSVAPSGTRVPCRSPMWAGELRLGLPGPADAQRLIANASLLATATQTTSTPQRPRPRNASPISPATSPMPKIDQGLERWRGQHRPRDDGERVGNQP